MSKLLIVARQEYVRAVKSKAFLVGLMFMPLLLGGLFVVAGLSDDMKDTDDRTFAVIDRSGELYAALEGASQLRNEAGIWSDDEGEDGEEREQVRSKFLLERADAAATDEEAVQVELSLAERVRDEELAGYVVLGADLFQDEGEDRELAWFTNKPTYGELPRWIERTVNAVIRRQRFAEEGLDESLIARLTRNERVREMGLPELSETGELIEAEETDEIANEVIPLVLAMLMYMMLAVSAPSLLNNILEEKMKKISEVLLSSVSPFRLLMGKLVSAVLVAVTLAAIYLGAGLAFAHNVDGVPRAVLEALRPEVIAWFVIFLVVGLVIFGSMFSALGAACSEIQDAQTMMMPAMLMLIFPVMVMGIVMDNPTGVPAQIASFIPPATPMLMLLRVTIPPGVAIWELLLALATSAAFACFCVFVAGKIFRIGILSQGQTPSYRNLVGWVFSK